VVDSDSLERLTAKRAGGLAKGKLYPTTSAARIPRPQDRRVSGRPPQDPRITQDEYDKKARELKERQSELATRLDQHQQGGMGRR
jgi:hypothetical protein